MNIPGLDAYYDKMAQDYYGNDEEEYFDYPEMDEGDEDD